MIYLLDTNVLIDVLNGRDSRAELVAQLSARDGLLACCSINVTEIYMGMRRGEEARTEQFLSTLEFYHVTWEAACLAGKLFRQWRVKGRTLALADLTIAAVAIVNELVLVTANVKDFPMPELRTLAIPENDA